MHIGRVVDVALDQHFTLPFYCLQCRYCGLLPLLLCEQLDMHYDIVYYHGAGGHTNNRYRWLVRCLARPRWFNDHALLPMTCRQPSSASNWYRYPRHWNGAVRTPHYIPPPCHTTTYRATHATCRTCALPPLYTTPPRAAHRYALMIRETLLMCHASVYGVRTTRGAHYAVPSERSQVLRWLVVGHRFGCALPTPTPTPPVATPAPKRAT